MKPERGSPVIDLETLPRMPSWVTSARAETLEDVAFLSGAALAVLHLVVSRGEVPQPLLRDRLALRAAEACVALAGRPERAADLRDEVHLLRPGDLPGPAGAICQRWRQAAARPVTPEGLHRALPDLTRAQIVVWLEAGQGGPVDRMAQVLEAVLAEDPRAEATALILADAALARVMGWDRLLPLLAAHLTARDLRKRAMTCGGPVTGRCWPPAGRLCRWHMILRAGPRSCKRWRRSCARRGPGRRSRCS